MVALVQAPAAEGVLVSSNSDWAKTDISFARGLFEILKILPAPQTPGFPSLVLSLRDSRMQCPWVQRARPAFLVKLQLTGIFRSEATDEKPRLG